MENLIGKTVTFARRDEWRGTVEGDSYLPGFLRISWEAPEKFIGHSRPDELVPVDDVQH